MGMNRGLMVFALTVACVSSPLPKPAPTPLPPVHVPTEASCERAQETLERLDCRRDDGSSWTTTPKGAPFADACKTALHDGRNWNPHCIMQIADCSELMCAYRGECCGANR